MTNTLAIAFTLDAAFVPKLGVCLHSLAAHAMSDVEYLIHIIGNDLDDADRAALERVVDFNPRCRVRHIAPPDGFQDTIVDPDMHFASQSAFHRLALPELFADRTLLLYCDCDVIFCDDVARLFEHEFSSGAEAAVIPAIGIIQAARRGRVIKHRGASITLEDYITQELGLSRVEDYFNSGVALLDISAIRASDRSYAADLKAIIHKEYHMPDQDMWNILFRGRSDLIAPRWNFQNPSLVYTDLDETMADRVEEARQDPAIIHYVTANKPWNTPGVLMADRFWDHARQTSFYDGLIEAFGAEAFAEVALPAPVPWPQDAVPRVSIVVPLFEVGRWIVPALASALRQSVEAEIIVVDDRSTDASPICAEYIARHHPRCQLIRLETRGYAGAARNRGLDTARGTYVAFMDPDDVYASDRALEDMVALADAEACDAVFGQQMSLRPTGEIVPKAAHENPQETGPVAFESCTALWAPLHHHRYLFRRAFLVENEILYSDHQRGQDVVFLSRVLAHEPALIALAAPVYLHRIRSERRVPTPQNVAELLEAFEEVLSNIAGAGRAAVTWRVLRSRFEMLLKDVHACRKAESLPALVTRFLAFRKYAAGASYTGTEDLPLGYPARTSDAMAYAILHLTPEALATILQGEADFPFALTASAPRPAAPQEMPQPEKETVWLQSLRAMGEKKLKAENDLRVQTKRVPKLEAELARARRDLNRLKQSRSFRFGHFVMRGLRLLHPSRPR